MAGAIKEHVIYIHGVSDYLVGRSHDAEYDALHGALSSRVAGFPKECCRVEWGWDHSGHPQGHELLTKAQEQLGSRALARVNAQHDFTLNPMRYAVNQFRGLMMLGFSDMFYYVSDDGKNSVRRAVASQILAFLKPYLEAPEPPRVSLTFIGHSAGSVIAFDLLFYLFWRPRASEAIPVVPERAAKAGEHSFIKPAETEEPDEAERTLNDLRLLRQMALNGSLRVRRLFTFGSPIALMAYRNNAVLHILAGGRRIESGFHGLTTDLAGENLPGPRWVNIWDKDDPIAWPVEDLMSGAGTVVVDRYIDV